jgi:hypothetical protein
MMFFTAIFILLISSEISFGLLFSISTYVMILTFYSMFIVFDLLAEHDVLHVILQ